MAVHILFVGPFSDRTCELPEGVPARCDLPGWSHEQRSRCQIRATYDERIIRVYQTYNDEMADTALAHGTFTSPPFKTERMTWIKPSFLRMMYRSGWGYKDRSQHRILAIDMSGDGFDRALQHSCGSHPDVPMSREDWARLKNRSPVRI